MHNLSNIDKFKLDLSERYLSMKEYFLKAFLLWKESIKTEKIFLILYSLQQFILSCMTTFIHPDNDKLYFMIIFLRYILYMSNNAISYVILKKIIYRIENKGSIDLKKSISRAFIYSAILSVYIIIRDLRNYFYSFNQYETLSVYEKMILFLTALMIIFIILGIIFIYLTPVFMARNLSVKESLKYTYRISKGKRLVALFLSIIYFLLNVFFLRLLSGVFKFNPVPPYGNLTIMYIIIQSMYYSFSILFLDCIIITVFLNVDYMKNK
jgi:hypothetical protein